MAGSTPEEPMLIVRRRTHFLVYGYDRGQSADGRKELDRELSVWETLAGGKRWLTMRAQLRDIDPFNRKVLRIPRGNLDEGLLSAAWPRHAWRDSTTPWKPRKIAVKFNVQDYPFRNHGQARAFNYLAGEDDEGRPEPGSRLLVAGTAEGKSYCSIRAWTRYGDVLLATFALAAHLQNFRSELFKFTDLTEEEVFVADDGRDSLKKAMKTPQKYKVALVLHRTVSNCYDAVIDPDGVVLAPGEFTEFVQALGIGTYISDECHMEYKSIAVLSMMLNVARTFYLTATLGRTDWKENHILMNILPTGTALVLPKEKRLRVRSVSFNSRPKQEEQARCTDRQRGFFNPVAYFDYIRTAEKYGPWWEMVSSLVEECFSRGATGVAVVLSGKLEFLDRVYADAVASMPQRSVGNFSSRTPISRRMEELDRDVIITTEKSFKGSVNPPRMSHMIVLAPIGSAIWIEQISGRLRGRDGGECILIDVWDRGFIKLIEQSRRRRTVFRKISKEIEEDAVDYY
jgi:hypothetical protein